MHIESTIELLNSIKEDILHAHKHTDDYVLKKDYSYSIIAIQDAIYGLKGAMKHFKHSEKD